MQFYAHFAHFLRKWAYICGVHFEKDLCSKTNKKWRKVPNYAYFGAFSPVWAYISGHMKVDKN